MPRIKPIDHEDRLSIIEHLDELRSRLDHLRVRRSPIAFGLCFWQNHLLLDIVNEPLRATSTSRSRSGPTEAFTTTMTVSAYFAILLALPVLLYQLYAFVLPAFTPREKKVALPLLLMVPVLFIVGVVFGYFVVLPRGARLPARLQRRRVPERGPSARLLLVRLADADLRWASCSRSRSACSR